jgi:hypothetical protein
MPTMSLVPRHARLAAATAVLVLVASAHAALARPKKAAKKYHFDLVEEIAAGKEVPADTAAELTPQVKELATKAFTTHERMVALDGAPDPKLNAAAFKKYLTKKKVAGAYRVNVEIVAYDESSEELEAPRSGKRLSVHVALRMFGETIPGRVMAFSGDGTATIKMEVGKQVRPRDRAAAQHDALEMAIADALGASLSKLDMPPPKPKK